MASGKFWVQGRNEDGLWFWANGFWTAFRNEAARLTYDEAERVLERTRTITGMELYQLRIVADVARGRK